MSDFKFELNRSGVRELLTSEKMKEIVSGHATSAVGRLGEGYKSDTHVGKNRVNAMVYADSIRAKIDNSRHNSLLKAVHK